MENNGISNKLVIPRNPKFRRISIWVEYLLNQDDTHMQELKDYLDGTLFGVSNKLLFQARDYVYNILSQYQTNKDCLYVLSLFFAKNWQIVPQNNNKAYELAKKSADMGSSWGALSVGYCCQHGIGRSQDIQEGLKCYQQSHDMGNHHGIFNLGVCYEHGLGASVNHRKAFSLYQKSSLHGNHFAIAGLGYCYENGQGIEKNSKKAFECYSKAANMGDIDAMNNLGTCYQFEKGTKKNIKKAAYWYLRAKKSGQTPHAKNNLKTLILHEDLTVVLKKKLKMKIEKEDDEIEKRPKIFYIMLVGYFKDENCIWFREKIPFEIFYMLLETCWLLPSQRGAIEEKEDFE